MRSVVAAAALLALMGHARAQEMPWPRYLIDLEGRANDLCRGYPGSGPEKDSLCQVNADIVRRLRAFNLCFGMDGQRTFEMQWHRCAGGSNRELPP